MSGNKGGQKGEFKLDAIMLLILILPQMNVSSQPTKARPPPQGLTASLTLTRTASVRFLFNAPMWTCSGPTLCLHAVCAAGSQPHA